MIVIVLSMSVLVLYAAYARVYTQPAWWLNIVVTLTLFGMHMLELLVLSPGNLFPFLDEQFFLRQSQAPMSHLLSGGLARYNGYLLYAALAQVYTPEWVLKAVNIPWLWVFIVQLYRMSGSSPWVLRLFPLALPYLYVLSFFNMRDMLGLVVAMMLISAMTTRLRYIDSLPARFAAFGLSAVTLGSLRPQWLLFLAVSAVLVAVLKGSRSTRILAVAVSLAAFVVLVPLLSVRLQQLRSVAEYSATARGSETVTMILGTGQFGPASAALGVVRQLITPLPTSKLIALVGGPMTPALYIGEFTRVIMNTWFIGSLFVVFTRPREFIAFVTGNNRMFLLAVFAAVNTIVYGIYFFGVGSSRNKVLPMIVVFLFLSHLLSRRNAGAALVRSPASDAPVPYRRLEAN